MYLFTLLCVFALINGVFPLTTDVPSPFATNDITTLWFFNIPSPVFPGVPLFFYSEITHDLRDNTASLAFFTFDVQMNTNFSLTPALNQVPYAGPVAINKMTDDGVAVIFAVDQIGKLLCFPALFDVDTHYSIITPDYYNNALQDFVSDPLDITLFDLDELDSHFILSVTIQGNNAISATVNRYSISKSDIMNRYTTMLNAGVFSGSDLPSLDPLTLQLIDIDASIITQASVLSLSSPSILAAHQDTDSQHTFMGAVTTGYDTGETSTGRRVLPFLMHFNDIIADPDAMDILYPAMSCKGWQSLLSTAFEDTTEWTGTAPVRVSAHILTGGDLCYNDIVDQQTCSLYDADMYKAESQYAIVVFSGARIFTADLIDLTARTTSNGDDGSSILSHSVNLLSRETDELIVGSAFQAVPFWPTTHDGITLHLDVADEAMVALYGSQRLKAIPFELPSEIPRIDGDTIIAAAVKYLQTGTDDDFTYLSCSISTDILFSLPFNRVSGAYPWLSARYQRGIGTMALLLNTTFPYQHTIRATDTIYPNEYRLKTRDFPIRKSESDTLDNLFYSGLYQQYCPRGYYCNTPLGTHSQCPEDYLCLGGTVVPIHQGDLISTTAAGILAVPEYPVGYLDLLGDFLLSSMTLMIVGGFVLLGIPVFVFLLLLNRGKVGKDTLKKISLSSAPVVDLQEFDTQRQRGKSAVKLESKGSVGGGVVYVFILLAVIAGTVISIMLLFHEPKTDYITVDNPGNQATTRALGLTTNLDSLSRGLVDSVGEAGFKVNVTIVGQFGAATMWVETDCTHTTDVDSQQVCSCSDDYYTPCIAPMLQSDSPRSWRGDTFPLNYSDPTSYANQQFTLDLDDIRSVSPMHLKLHFRGLEMVGEEKFEGPAYDSSISMIKFDFIQNSRDLDTCPYSTSGESTPTSGCSVGSCSPNIWPTSVIDQTCDQSVFSYTFPQPDSPKSDTSIPQMLSGSQTLSIRRSPLVWHRSWRTEKYAAATWLYDVDNAYVSMSDPSERLTVTVDIWIEDEPVTIVVTSQPVLSAVGLAVTVSLLYGLLAQGGAVLLLVMDIGKSVVGFVKGVFKSRSLKRQRKKQLKKQASTGRVGVSSVRSHVNL